MRFQHFYLLVCLVVASATQAQSPFFWDDFDRESFYEGPVEYSEEPDAEITLESGSAIFKPLADNHPGLWVTTPPYGDVSLRAQIRLLDVANCAINPWVGLLVREISGNGNNEHYWAGPAADGIIYLGNTPNGSRIRRSMGVHTCSELKSNDVNMQLDAIGDTFTYRSWLEGTPKPIEPQLEFVDDQSQWGDFLGIFMNPDSTLSGMAVRYLALLPPLDGDYDGDGSLSVSDLDMLINAIQTDSNNRVFDLTTNEIDANAAPVDSSDIGAWLSHASELNELDSSYLRGDSNLDGRVDSTDLNAVGLHWNQEVNTWSGGDFNADGIVDSTDLNFIGLNWQASSIAAANKVPVPEPNIAVCWLAVCAAFARRRLERWTRA